MHIPLKQSEGEHDMVKMNFTNNQTAFEYALYMIAASYFDKTVCLSRITERNMFLQYKEQKLIKQYQMEEICISFMDELISKLPSSYFNRSVDVKLNRITPYLTEIAFLDEHMAITFRALYAGKKSKIIYQLWKKGGR